jgi:hypothetical protein
VPNDDPTTQPSSGGPTEPTCIPRYEIRLNGHLGSRWAAWFDGLDLVAADDGTTVLCGPVVDQAALHGLLLKLRDLGIPLVSLTALPTGNPTEPSDPSNRPSAHHTSGAAS